MTRMMLVDTTLYAPLSPFFVDAAGELGYEPLFIDVHYHVISAGLHARERDREKLWQ